MHDTTSKNREGGPGVLNRSEKVKASRKPQPILGGRKARVMHGCNSVLSTWPDANPHVVPFLLKTDEQFNATNVSVSVSKYFELPWFRVNAHEPKALHIGTS